MLIVLFILAAAYSCNIENAHIKYHDGVKNWDVDKFAVTISFLEGCSDSVEYRAASELRFLSYWRQTLHAFIMSDKKGIKQNAHLAEKAVSSFDKKFGRTELSTTVKALSYQMLSSVSVASAIRNGPKAAELEKNLEKWYGNSYWTRLIKSINKLQAPAFAGGNIDSATTLLKSMYLDFPDSSTVIIHLAVALYRNKQKKEADKLLEELLKREPLNLWALKAKE